MDMVDLKKTIVELTREAPKDRGRVSIYVSKSIWAKFKKLTENAGASLVLEKWMEQAIQESDKKK